MRVVVIAALLCAIVGVCGLSAPPFSSVGTVAGKTVLWFAGTEVTMAFEGTMQIIGDLEIAGAPVGFTAAGPIRGEGEGDTMTLTGMLWTTFIAEGTLETGEPIVIRGGASASGEDLVLTAEASGSGGGAFVASIEVGDGMLRVSGEVAGSVGGTFVPPDDPYTHAARRTGNPGDERCCDRTARRYPLRNPDPIERLGDRLRRVAGGDPRGPDAAGRRNRRRRVARRSIRAARRDT